MMSSFFSDYQHLVLRTEVLVDISERWPKSHPRPVSIQATNFNSGYTLELPGELLKLPMPGPHPQTITSKSLGLILVAVKTHQVF